MNTGKIVQNETNETNLGLARQLPKCVDIDECSKQSACPDNSKCRNTEGSYFCDCFDGFGGDYCTDNDECSTTNSCDNNAKCLNTDGSYECGCKDGYYGNGELCFPGRCPESNCPENQKCVSATTTNCECKEGFRSNNFSACIDVDECEKIKCDDQAECLNTIGTYICRELPRSTTASSYTTSASTKLTTTKATLATVVTTALTIQTSFMTKQPVPTAFQ